MSDNKISEIVATLPDVMSEENLVEEAGSSTRVVPEHQEQSSDLETPLSPTTSTGTVNDLAEVPQEVEERQNSPKDIPSLRAPTQRPSESPNSPNTTPTMPLLSDAEISQALGMEEEKATSKSVTSSPEKSGSSEETTGSSSESESNVESKRSSKPKSKKPRVVEESDGYRAAYAYAGRRGIVSPDIHPTATKENIPISPIITSQVPRSESPFFPEFLANVTYEEAMEGNLDIRSVFTCLFSLPLYRPDILTVQSIFNYFSHAPTLHATAPTGNNADVSMEDLGGSTSSSSKNIMEDSRDLQLAIFQNNATTQQRNKDLIMHFVQKLDDFCQRGFYHDLDTSTAVWRFLKDLSDPSGQSTSGPRKWMHQDKVPKAGARAAAHASYVILQFHLVDRMAWVYGVTESNTPNGTRRRIDVDGYKAVASQPQVEKILREFNDWKVVLDEAFKILPSHVQAEDETTSQALQQHWNKTAWTDSTASEVLNSLSEKSRIADKERKWAGTCANFIRAAIALNMITTGDVFLTKEDFKAKHPRMVNRKDQVQLSPVLNPLIVALAISPILLFSSLSLTNNLITQRHYQDLVTTLGNGSRPPILETMEKATWMTLFLIARGAPAAQRVAILLDFWMQKWSATAGLHREVCCWFKNPAPAGSANVTQVDENVPEEPESGSESMDVDQVGVSEEVNIKVERLEHNKKVRHILEQLDIDLSINEHRVSMAQLQTALQEEMLLASTMAGEPAKSLRHVSPIQPPSPSAAGPSGTGNFFPDPNTFPEPEEGGLASESEQDFPNDDITEVVEAVIVERPKRAAATGKRQDKKESPKKKKGGKKKAPKKKPAKKDEKKGEADGDHDGGPDDDNDDDQVEPLFTRPRAINKDVHFNRMLAAWQKNSALRVIEKVNQDLNLRVDRKPATLAEEDIWLPAYSAATGTIVQVKMSPIIMARNDDQQAKFAVALQKALRQNNEQVLNAEESNVAVVNFDDFINWDAKRTQHRFHKSNILVRGVPSPETPWGWNADSMSRLGNLYTSTDVQDMAYRDGDHPNAQLRLGTRMDILKSGLAEADLAADEQWYTRKVFNGLNNPAPEPLAEMPNFWRIASHENVFKNNDVAYGEDINRRAIPDMSWATTASQHSISDVHMDTDGLGTVSRPLVGKKLWILLTPLKENIRDVNAFTDKIFTELDLSEYKAEALLLEPGQVLYQRPNQLHWVYGVEKTMVYGRHFYAQGSLAASLYGQVHTQFIGRSLTNASHPEVRPTLGDFMTLWYNTLASGAENALCYVVPDLTKKDGLENFIAVANAVVFSHTLSCHEGIEADRQDVQLCARRATNMASYLAMMEHFLSKGYGRLKRGTTVTQYRDNAYNFFEACNIHFAQALISYAVVSHGDEGTGYVTAQRVYELLRQDLGQMWGHKGNAVQELDDYALNSDGQHVAEMYPNPPPIWVKEERIEAPPTRPDVPIAELLQAQKRARSSSNTSVGPQRKVPRSREPSPAPEPADGEQPRSGSIEW